MLVYIGGEELQVGDQFAGKLCFFFLGGNFPRNKILTYPLGTCCSHSISWHSPETKVEPIRSMEEILAEVATPV